MFERLGIAGVGLIGGSIALAARQRGLCRSVLGIGRRESSLQQARDLGVIDDYALTVGADLADVDLLVAAVPVDQIADLILQAAGVLPAHALVTDAGSTKARIVARVTAEWPTGDPVRFVGAHPLAGSEKSGVAAARADLLTGALCVVTPTVPTDSAASSRIQQFWRELGMRVRVMEPAAHDEVLARTSHLPHLAAAALASLLQPGDRDLSGTGLRDTTRIAAGDPDLWLAIVRENRAPIAAALRDLEHTLADLRAALSDPNPDDAAVHRLLAVGKKQRDALNA